MKKAISIFVAISLVLSSMSVFASFSDITPSTMEWAGEAIERLKEKLVIDGYGDGTFRPDGNITRAEFAKMLACSLELPAGNKVYDDTANHWAKNYIAAVSDFAYIENTLFEPDKMAKRGDIAYAAAMALGLSKPADDKLSQFADGEDVPVGMKDAVSAAVKSGIILGYEDNSIRINNPVTRAEACVIITRAIDIKNEGADIIAPEKPGDEVTPSSGEKPQDKPQDTPQDTPDQSLPGSEKGHLYSLYPQRELILVQSVLETSDHPDQEVAYRINYRLANGEEEYSSVVPADTKVEGVKSSMAEIKSGDVLVMNTAFHGYIGSLIVLAEFGKSEPVISVSKDDSTAKYQFMGGKIKSMNFTNRTVNIGIESEGTEKNLMVLKSTPTNVFSPWKKNSPWSISDLGDIDFENEDVYVYIRYTNGVSTDIILSDNSR